MSKESQQHPVSLSSVNAEFVRMQLEQVMETFRAQYTLLIQVTTALVLGNITVAGFALSTQRAGILFIGFLFPIMILYVIYRINKTMVPIVYTAINLEHKYGENGTDWLASTFIATASSAEAIGILREICAEQDYAQRINRLRGVHLPVLGSGKGLTRTTLVLIAVGQLVAPFILALVFQWSLF